MGKEVTTFYRYIRPRKFDEKRMDYVTLPKGGVCLRFEDIGGSLMFTHSRCHLDDLFNKGVAKAIADGRADRAKTDERVVKHMSGIPIIQDTHLLVTWVIDKCRDYPYLFEAPLVVHYMRHEWHGLANALDELMRIEARAVQQAVLWESAVKAMHNPHIYHEKANR